MRLLSVNVGRPRQVLYRGRAVMTGIFKEPVEGRVAVGRLNLEGDQQADLQVHGGVDKAVYCYPHEHYEFWRRELDRDDFVLGQFGENLTTTGMLEEDVLIGDIYRIGTARVQISQPRMPCFKLGIRMNDPGILKPFLQSLRVGFYVRVLEEGEVAAGDQIERLERDESSLSVREVCRLFHFERDDHVALRRAADLSALPIEWRDGFLERLG